MDRNLLAYQIAEVYAWRGETDKAFEWLQISYDNHDTGLLSLLIDPLMRGLRDDPRYKIMVEKVGLPTIAMRDRGGPFFAELKRRNVYKVADRVRGGCLVAHPNRDPGFSVL